MPTSLPISGPKENRPLDLDAKQKEDVLKNIQKAVESLQFFAYLVQNGTIGVQEAHTHMSLLKYAYQDLAEATGQGALDQELEEKTAMLRAANQQIRVLEAQLGQGVTTDAAVQHIASLQEYFWTWCSLSGFHYASLKQGRWCLEADFSDEIDYTDRKEDRSKVTFGDKDLAGKILNKIPYLFDGQSRYDIYRDTFHGNMLDTDTNRYLLKELFKSTFPGSRISEFQSRADQDRFTLRFTALVDYRDISAWHSRMVNGTDS